MRAGWLTAIRSAQARLHEGLEIRVPVLIATSGTTYRGHLEMTEAAHEADAVLDPAHMWQWGPGIGGHVTIVRFAGARHDVMLCRKPVRDRVFEEFGAWMRAYFRER